MKVFTVVGVVFVLAFASAEESCPANQVYLECGTACPITCANKDNPPSICPLYCVSGCFCMSSYYKAADGSCVTEDACGSSQVTPATEPTTETVCPSNQVFSTCGSACPPTCANKDNPPACTDECVAKCTCPSGMVATDTGSCVTPDNCPVATPESCQLPPDSGLCEAYMPSYFYNSTAGNCHIFIYGGCQGNDNRYSTYQECMDACSQVEVGLPTVAAEYTTKETCPLFADGLLGTCEESCTPDGCPSGQQCCSNGCGHSCMESAFLPYYTTPMSCPPIDPIFGIFCTLDFGCQGHDECESGELCCPTGCGSSCQTAVIPSPLCTEVNVQASSSGLLGAYIPQCDSQGNFSAVQCHEAECWCVDPATGVPVSSPVMVPQQPACSQSTCEYNGNTYTEGQNFPSSDGCNTCFCSGGSVSCTEKACLCEYNGKFYTAGENFPSSDGCNSCFCGSGGIVGCTLMACLPLGKTCEYNGQVYDNGTTFLASDGCNTCNCIEGDAFCTQKGCLCESGGLEVVAGSPLDIGCAVCNCIWAIQSVSCTPKTDDSCVPVRQTKQVSMKFSGDYDSIDDMDGFKQVVRNTLVDLYGPSMNLRDEQITDVEVTRGSVVIGLTLQDVDGGANVTLLVVAMHNDYKNESIVFIYHEVILIPPDDDDDSDFSVEDSDQDESIEVLYISLSVVGAVMIALAAGIVILAIAVVRLYRKRTPFAHLMNSQSCGVNEDEDFEMKVDLSKSDKA